MLQNCKYLVNYAKIHIFDRLYEKATKKKKQLFCQCIFTYTEQRCLSTNDLSKTEKSYLRSTIYIEYISFIHGFEL